MKVLALVLAAVAFAADIPRTWEKAAVDTLELPLANQEFSPTHIDEAAYYRIDDNHFSHFRSRELDVLQ
jgi:hypothetical protein